MGTSLTTRRDYMKSLTLAIDQSTQGSKVLLVDDIGEVVYQNSLNHRQIINKKNWISHDLDEIRNNLKRLIHSALTHCDKSLIRNVAITNQRETAAAWSKNTGSPLAHSIVWQDNRAQNIINKKKKLLFSQNIKELTGLDLSPYFTAAKFEWLLTNVSKVKEAEAQHDLCLGTIDSWLLYQLTNGKSFYTEPSNASRTQLLNLNSCDWDSELCKFFGIKQSSLPKVLDSNSTFGMTDLFGELSNQIPINSVLGDSQAALRAENCVNAGECKVTFGTGSSVVLNTGQQKIQVKGLNTSIAWRTNNVTTYILEGNINYSGAIITWLKDKLQVIDDPSETSRMAKKAINTDTTLLIPAFSGLAAPYNSPGLKATFTGMSINTGRNEIVRSALDSIIFQITDILHLMQTSFPQMQEHLYADGGMIRNDYLMQRLSDISQLELSTAKIKELSAIGTSVNSSTFSRYRYHSNKTFTPKINQKNAQKQIEHWNHCVQDFINIGGKKYAK